MKIPFLNGLAARDFLSRYWQKEPLFVPAAFRSFSDLLSVEQLIEISFRDDMQSRLVIERGKQWTVKHGPLKKGDFRRLKGEHWSLLVQGVDQVLPAGKSLLQQFSFIPSARLDDLMISFSPNGGGVGPHFDSYDVFLLQGLGHKRWQVSGQSNRTLVRDAPLRILERFRSEQEWIVEAGDLLYLPPKYAHYGVALDDCLTYSIGFRAPSAQELVGQFLGFLEERIACDGMYEDPDLTPQRHPAQISPQMVERVTAILAQITWGRSEVADFLGGYLTEPKPHVFFDPPPHPLSRKRFGAAVAKKGLSLALKSQLLFHGKAVFINGEKIHATRDDRQALARLGDERKLDTVGEGQADLLDVLYEWYRAGYVELGTQRRR